MGDHAAQAHRVDLDAGRPAPPRAPGEPRRWSGPSAHSSRRRGHALGGEHRRARRRVDLLVVVQLDDLGRLEAGAASSAKRIISTAPMAKLGAITQLLSVNACASRSRSSSVKPVVPTTAWMPLAADQARFVAGRVDQR